MRKCQLLFHRWLRICCYHRKMSRQRDCLPFPWPDSRTPGTHHPCRSAAIIAGLPPRAISRAGSARTQPPCAPGGLDDCGNRRKTAGRGWPKPAEHRPPRPKPACQPAPTVAAMRSAAAGSGARRRQDQDWATVGLSAAPAPAASIGGGATLRTLTSPRPIDSRHVAGDQRNRRGLGAPSCLRCSAGGAVPIVGLPDPGLEVDPWAPAERREPGNVEDLSRGSVGL